MSNYQYVKTYRDIYPCTTNPPTFDPWNNTYMGTRKIAMHIRPSKGCIILINSISSNIGIIICVDTITGTNFLYQWNLAANNNRDFVSKEKILYSLSSIVFAIRNMVLSFPIGKVLICLTQHYFKLQRGSTKYSFSDKLFQRTQVEDN